MKDQLTALLDNLLNLGAKRLAILGAVGVISVAIITFGAYYLNKPAFETMYVGLDRDDVNRMGLVLSQAGISYDVDKDGTSILVEAGKAAKARMILAEKGLPGSSGAGYELFDNLGSLGLTSFMQEVTKVRALEGEISRSIQAINGVKIARVHLVMPDRTGFRDRDRKPTASVLISASSSDIANKAEAIRHLVASAVPGLSADNVTVLDSNGQMLAGGSDPFSDSANNTMDIERTVEGQIERSIADAIGPHLGAGNFRVSVRADIDTDRRQIEETIYDPDSRVERSVQVVKVEDKSTKQDSSEVASVEQNLPEIEEVNAQGGASSEERQRREETTNYEINSKRIATVSNGYEVKRLSIAIVLNKARMTALVGENAGPEELQARLVELKQVASAAAGISADRGDELTLASIEFVDEEMVGASDASLLDWMSDYTGSAINALAFIIVSILVLTMGVRPLISALGISAKSEEEDGEQGGAIALADGTSSDNAMIAQDGVAEPNAQIESNQERAAKQQNLAAQALQQKGKDAAYIAEILNDKGRSPKDRLAAMVEFDEERTAQVLRRWITIEAA